MDKFDTLYMVVIEIVINQHVYCINVKLPLLGIIIASCLYKVVGGAIEI